MAWFTSETGRKALARRGGLAAARYWRERGWPNLAKARAVLAERRRRGRVRHAIVSCSAAPGLWHCTCGLNGWGEASITVLHRKALCRVEDAPEAARRGKSLCLTTETPGFSSKPTARTARAIATTAAKPASSCGCPSGDKTEPHLQHAATRLLMALELTA